MKLTSEEVDRLNSLIKQVNEKKLRELSRCLYDHVPAACIERLDEIRKDLLLLEKIEEENEA